MSSWLRVRCGLFRASEIANVYASVVLPLLIHFVRVVPSKKCLPTKSLHLLNLCDPSKWWNRFLRLIFFTDSIYCTQTFHFAMAQPLAPSAVPAHERWIRIDENMNDGYIGSGTYGKVS